MATSSVDLIFCSLIWSPMEDCALKTVWLTYSWADEFDDVRFIVQELSPNLNVRLDRWDLGAGRRLWDQIASFI